MQDGQVRSEYGVNYKLVWVACHFPLLCLLHFLHHALQLVNDLVTVLHQFLTKRDVGVLFSDSLST